MSGGKGSSVRGCDEETSASDKLAVAVGMIFEVEEWLTAL